MSQKEIALAGVQLGLIFEMKHIMNIKNISEGNIKPNELWMGRKVKSRHNLKIYHL